MNIGFDGQSTSSMILNSFYNPANYVVLGKHNVQIVWEFINDIYFGKTLSQAYNNIVTYCNNQRSNYEKIIIVTVLPINRAASGLSVAETNAIHDTFNTTVRTNYSQFADAYIEVRDDDLLNNYNSSVYTDGIHLNEAGYRKIALKCLDKLKQLY